MPLDQSHIISLDYGDRKTEREFVRQLLHRYDRDSLVGCALFINNNPYHLESFLCLNFWDKNEDFESWLETHFPEKKRDYRFLSKELADAVFSKGFNVIMFSDDKNLELVMSDEANGLYLFHSREKMNGIFGSPSTASTFSVFLSHSSQDKLLVDQVFDALHKSGIRAWYDKYEIRPGDSITNRINQGLSTSNLGLLFLSRNFLDKRSGWPMNEANFFFQQRMHEAKKKFVVINVDLTIDDMPPLLRDYRFIDLQSPHAHQEIIDIIKHEKSAS
jgi:TIR domain